MGLLTARRHEILQLAAQGYSHRESAADIGLAPQTVRHHLQAIRIKLKARNTAHAVAIALTQHLITLEDSHDG